MSDDKDGFVSWEERIVCAERGNRVVHFYLKDVLGNSVLAVVGTERSIRHMMYVPTDEFVRAYGSDGLIKGYKKWRARREVVEVLSSLVANSETDDTGEALGSSEVMPSRKMKAVSSEIEWSGVGWVCAKQLKHYPAFCRHKIIISVHSFVSIMAEEDPPYLGYLEDLYEDKKGLKKVKVRWFLCNQEARRVIPQLNLHPKEVLVTPYVQVISAECVDAPATILTPLHYEKCMALASLNSSAGIHMCSRQFKINKVKPFALAKLSGYSNQAVLSFLGGDAARVSSENVNHRSCKSNHVNGSSGIRSLAPISQTTKYESACPKLKLTLSRKNKSIKLTTTETQVSFSFRVNDMIEVLCQDSGIRGCWFRCQILQRTEKHLKVKYNDLLDADETGNLEEWVPASRVAAPDKLGMRSPGRHTIRPCPPKNFGQFSFEVGMPVDAWWCDGWWEGVVTGINLSGQNSLEVYFPGEDRLLSFKKKHLRVSRDWVDNCWVDVKAKPDIISFLSANTSVGIKFSSCSAIEEAPDCDGSGSQRGAKKFLSTSCHREIDMKDPESPRSFTPRDLMKHTGAGNQKKQTCCFSGDGVQKSTRLASNNDLSDSAAAAASAAEGSKEGKSMLDENVRSSNRLFEIADAVELVTQTAAAEAYAQV